MQLWNLTAALFGGSGSSANRYPFFMAAWREESSQCHDNSELLLFPEDPLRLREWMLNLGIVG